MAAGIEQFLRGRVPEYAEPLCGTGHGAHPPCPMGRAPGSLASLASSLDVVPPMRWYLHAVQGATGQDAGYLPRRVDLQRAKLVGLSLTGRAGLLSEELLCADHRAVVALCESRDASVWLSAMLMAVGTRRPLIVIHDVAQLHSVPPQSGWTLFTRSLHPLGDRGRLAGFEVVIEATGDEELSERALELIYREERGRI